MKTLSSAKCYALAYYPFIEDKFEEIINKMESISIALFNEQSIGKFLNHPAFSYDKKIGIIKNILQDYTDIQIERLFFLLIRKRKVVIFPEIIAELKKIHAQYQEIETVTIKSSQELSENEKKELLSKIKLGVSKKILGEFIVDRKLISGLIINVGDRKIDYSLKGKLNGLKDMLALNQFGL